MSDKADAKESALIPAGNSSLTTRSSAIIKRGLEDFISQQGRIIRFPAECSIGTLYMRYQGDESYNAWRKFAEARGDIVVPAGKELKLRVSEESLPIFSILPRSDRTTCKGLTSHIPRSVTPLWRGFNGVLR